MIYELKSILAPIRLSDLFLKEQPLEVELGSGDGSFLVEYARHHPERNFIGVERLLGRLRKMERKCRRANLENLGAVRIESAYFLRYLLPRGLSSALHIYFPDPWPKRKHRRHRLVNESFPQLAHQVLGPEGAVFLRTDDLDYFEQMQAVFSVSTFFQRVDVPQELSLVTTDFEREFNARGVLTRSAAYRKIPKA
jgi:tRNA (guanine-N7-)-methyltransferase